MSFKRRTPYYHKHAAMNAEFADRMGFAAAVNFGSVEAEHNAARHSVGLFDVYSQFLLEVTGQDAVKLMQKVSVNDIQRVPVGGVVYTSLCNTDGGMIDDLLVYRLAEDKFWLAPTPSRLLVVEDWLVSNIGDLRVLIVKYGARYAYISIQGPNSRTLLSRLTDVDISPIGLKYFNFTSGKFADVENVMISRTGYSGELGFELFYPTEYAEYMWDKLVDAGVGLGVMPCGLQSLGTLRMEKKFPLYGLDLSTRNTPVEAGLGWTVRLDKGDFIGRDVIARQMESGVSRKLMLISVDEFSSALAIGDTITSDGHAVGKVTSVAKGYTVGKSLAQGYITSEFAKAGQNVSLEGAGGRFDGTLYSEAIYDPNRSRARS